jgi:hypothetical protein
VFPGLKGCHFELVMHLDRGVIQRDIVGEDFRNGRLLKDRLPRALRLTRPAIDTFIGVDVELVWKRFSIVAYVLINAVHRTNTHASCIETVSAKTGNGPRHLVVYTSKGAPLTPRLRDAPSESVGRFDSNSNLTFSSCSRSTFWIGRWA